MAVITNNLLRDSLFFKERKLNVGKDIFKLEKSFQSFNTTIQKFRKPSQKFLSRSFKD